MKKILYLLLFLPLLAQAQIITTFAGPGTVGPGDGGPATAANLGAPNGGVFDKYGNFYFVEIVGNRIRKVDCFGIITTVAGNGLGGYSGDGGAATAAKIHGPSGVAFDRHGDLYFAETQNNIIRKVDMITGIISTFVGTSTGGFGGDNGPATAAMIWDPQDVSFDKLGNLYLADGFNRRIRKVDTVGIISTYAGNGTLSYLGDGIPATSTGFDIPYGVTADDTGNIYVASTKVYKVNTSGTIITFAGDGVSAYIGDGVPATSANLLPLRVSVDNLGNLLIADRYNQRIYKVDLSGILHLLAGNGTSSYSGDGGPATAAGLYGASGATVDQCGNLYITEVDNDRIRKVTYSTTCNPCSSPLGINEIIITSAITIYPNPATQSLTISAPDNINTISITNLLGQTIYNKQYNSTQVQIDVADLPAGVYLIRINGIEMRKFVKQ